MERCLIGADILFLRSWQSRGRMAVSPPSLLSSNSFSSSSMCLKLRSAITIPPAQVGVCGSPYIPTSPTPHPLGGLISRFLRLISISSSQSDTGTHHLPPHWPPHPSNSFPTVHPGWPLQRSNPLQSLLCSFFSSHLSAPHPPSTLCFLILGVELPARPFRICMRKTLFLSLCVSFTQAVSSHLWYCDLK